jgi:hypothetical protein
MGTKAGEQPTNTKQIKPINNFQFFIIQYFIIVNDTHKKREPTAIGSFGLPHPHLPTCRKAHV